MFFFFFEIWTGLYYILVGLTIIHLYVTGLEASPLAISLFATGCTVPTTEINPQPYTNRSVLRCRQLVAVVGASDQRRPDSLATTRCRAFRSLSLFVNRGIFSDEHDHVFGHLGTKRRPMSSNQDSHWAGTRNWLLWSHRMVRVAEKNFHHSK